MRGRRIGMVFQDPLTSLNPLYRIGDQIVETIRTHADVSESAGARARHRAAAGGRHPGRAGAHRQLPARVLRRHAPARGAGAGAVRGARPADRRRADDRARRVDPGADHRAPEAAVPGARHRRHADHPRHGRDRRDGRPRGRHVCRAHRRDRPGARRGQEPAPSLHEGADGRDPDGRRDASAAWCRSPAPCRALRPSRTDAPFIRAARRPSIAAAASGPSACRRVPRRPPAGSFAERAGVHA